MNCSSERVADSLSRRYLATSAKCGRLANASSGWRIAWVYTVLLATSEDQAHAAYSRMGLIWGIQSKQRKLRAKFGT